MVQELTRISIIVIIDYPLFPSNKSTQVYQEYSSSKFHHLEETMQQPYPRLTPLRKLVTWHLLRFIQCYS